jgi:hypothetical protein
MVFGMQGTTSEHNKRIHGGEIMLKSILGFKKYIHVNCNGYVREGRYPMSSELAVKFIWDQER